ncbi:hypothetical protein XELAEV_18043970mg [Xenopus laevis]|uniref:Uncharacterized protein n=1 Tax=Xenopus laevis TaxID=8355 RepID=A0A974BY82_XENLA|nr:hypothetical protein XELAEV_18043970mg [Xenopus laevis]
MFPFVSQYSTQSKEIERIVYRYWPLLQKEKTLRSALANPPVFSYIKRQIIKGDTTCHPANGTPVKLKQFATSYIGQPIRAVKTHIKEHKDNIRNYKKGTATDTTVSRHFNTANYNQSPLKWAILEVIRPQNRGGNPKKRILQREAYWIKTFDTLHPKGLNNSWSVKCFL